ncbi:serine hydrolase domain-containing protein [Psychroserpens luteolus]|uniref:serine hydrolase domain-containing protein n=1 Tax=Psychroserpens luteolus TaxID=2855840 RepID=UPI001E5D4046|nr:serine hydrolase domain-containing protein [Psychroserpens luteolus]
MTKTNFCIILSLIIVNSFSQAQKKPQQASLYSKIDTYLTAGSKNGFSGAISVVKDGEIIINKGYGIANKDTQILNNPNTIFDIGSNSKQFTATAILKLAELGKLNLTDSLSKFFINLPKEKQYITIHQLLSHSAGFIDAIGNDFDKISQKQFFEKLFASKLLSEPGEKYSYSNTGYSILGRIIELSSGQSYETFLNEYLFAPAGMKQTGYLLPKWNTKQMSRGYNRNVLETDPTITRYQRDGDVTWHLKANGGINSTQNDMLLWYKALKTNTILSKESFKKLTTPYISMNSEKTHKYGYGWVINESISNTLRFSHNGSNGTFSHTILWYPKKNTYIVYSTNANSTKVENIAYVVAKIILDKSYVPKPIKDNIYSFTMSYINQHSTDKSNALAALLKENYADDFNSGLFNTIGNLLLKSNENLNWALELFKMNVQLYPEDGNLWDSLGDGYKANNLKEDAIKSYQKAIEFGNIDSQKKLIELIKN